MDGLKRIKNVICYTIGILSIIGSLVLIAFGSFHPDKMAFTLAATFALGFLAVVAMDLIEAPEVVFLISKKRMRRLLNEDKLLPGKYWLKAKGKYIGVLSTYRNEVIIKEFKDKQKMKNWLMKGELDS